MNNSCFEAFGKPVPENRRAKALNFLNSVMVDRLPMEVGFVLDCGVRAVEKDRAMYLYDDIKSYLDVTGYYRLLAELCAD